jgi:hypothetical protein
MIVEDVREYDKTTFFENLSVGDVFESCGEFFLKTSDKYIYEESNAFNLTLNKLDFIGPNGQVIPVKATIEISNY